MHPVTVTSHYALPVVVDQCPGCGGLWFDENELGRAANGEAEKIDPLDTQALQRVSPMPADSLKCPGDGTALNRFCDPFFPPDIILDRCSSCGGTWLNRGEFARYQQFRGRRAKRKEDDARQVELTQTVSELLETHDSGGSSRTLERLGSFLSTPVENYPLNVMGAPGNSNPAGSAAVTAINVVLALLRAFVLRC